MQLPISMIPSDYGTIIATTLFNEFTRYIVDSNRRIFEIDVSSDTNINKVRIPGASDLSWTDVKTIKGFKRIIGKSTYYFVDGELILRKQEVLSKAFTKSKVDCEILNNFITMDIETVKKGKLLTPYLICGYNGKDFIESYGSDDRKLFSNFIDGLCTFYSKNGKKLIVYAHNFSGFDGIFMMKHLLDIGKVQPLIHNGRIISIKVKLNMEGYKGKTIIFKDSYLLLPQSLRNLCKTFGVSLPKGYFPFKLANIFYTGVFPKFEYWTGISLDQWIDLKKEYGLKMWDFRVQAIKYCKLDCKCLHEVLSKFNELIFKKWKINIHNCLTLPSLAMRLFKTHYMPKDSVYQLHSVVEQNIRRSYSGGAVDVYIPHNRILSEESSPKIESLSDFIKYKDIKPILNITDEYKKLFVYDVNSLYPYVMANKFMPIGKPISFIGNIRKVDLNAFGFFYCKITSPYNLEHPILQHRVKTINGLRTIAGLGYWEGWIFSEEMDNAIKFGYKFEILKGYEFDKANIFEKYVNDLYQLRLKYPKSDPMNLIAKLLMNSLYGKFGMKSETTIVEIFNTSCSNQLELLSEMLDTFGNSVQDYIKLDNHFITIRDNINLNSSDDTFHGLDVNIAIASAITAGGRMWMTIFKNNPLFKLFYSDTDSIVVDKPLPADMVGSELGKYKLEHVIKHAVFLAPKVYGFITEDNTEIIKIKGVKPEAMNDIHLSDLENLLIKDSSKEFTQEKWIKKVLEGEISVVDTAYTLKVTSNKRECVYIDNIFENTKPFHYNNFE